MSSFFDSGPLPDWKVVQQWLGKDLPWKLVEQWDKPGDTDWLNQYVKNMMTHAKKDARVKSRGLVRMDVQKDKKFVTVTMHLDPNVDYRDLQLFAVSDRLRVTGLPNEGKQAVRFPCLVYARSGKAEMRKGQLIVRFKRRPPEKSEYELFIQP
ncbi:hypothetical protein [Cohnella yongneupensis]|uniref:SHSP domain-containing protein n=1 Tax=Cohnella yongneupensis TaxID=425006 RepID=A0ABW0R4Y9_9BACL